jgi:uncharacterized protein (TIGR00251 family)
MMDVPYRRTKKGIAVNIRVESRSSRAEVSGVQGDFVKAKLTAPPVGGAANKQLIELLSEFFSVRKSCIRIIRGASSKNKVVEIEGIEKIQVSLKRQK